MAVFLVSPPSSIDKLFFYVIQMPLQERNLRHHFSF